MKKKKNKKKEKARSILLEIPRVSDYCRYTNIKQRIEKAKKGDYEECVAIHYLMW